MKLQDYEKLLYHFENDLSDQMKTLTILRQTQYIQESKNINLKLVIDNLIELIQDEICLYEDEHQMSKFYSEQDLKVKYDIMTSKFQKLISESKDIIKSQSEHLKGLSFINKIPNTLKSKHVDISNYSKQTYNSSKLKKLSQHKNNSTQNLSQARSNSVANHTKNFVEELNQAWVDNIKKSQDKLILENKQIFDDSQNQQNQNELNHKKSSFFTFPKAENVIQNELQMMKKIVADLSQKVDTHSHLNYDEELHRLQIENQKITQEYEQIKQENNEMQQVIHSFKKQIKEQLDQNRTLWKELKNLKNSNIINIKQNLAQSPQYENDDEIINQTKHQSHFSRFLIPDKKSFNQESSASWVQKRLI